MFCVLQWAVNNLKKPIVTMNWLEQCWIEHRVVPHEPYRIPPFSGLNICITKIEAGRYLTNWNDSLLYLV
jgi:topoisomerase (DNA) II binding protein 1